MSAPLATMIVCGAGVGATAMGSPRSFSTAFDDHKKGRSSGAFSCGHVACGVARVDHVVKADRNSSRFVLALILPSNWPDLCARPFSHSHRRASFLLPSTRRAGAVSLRAGHPIHAIRLQSGRAQSLADQLRSQIVAAPVIHHLCLSPTRLDCINAIEKELTRGTEALSPDDKIHD